MPSPLSVAALNAALGDASTEQTVKIIFVPQAVFRVRAVTRCTSTLPGHAEALLSLLESPPVVLLLSLLVVVAGLLPLLGFAGVTASATVRQAARRIGADRHRAAQRERRRAPAATELRRRRRAPHRLAAPGSPAA